MQIIKLDHVNLRTTQLERMVDWYTIILGLHAGSRPGYRFPGAWMYAGETAVVHLVGIDGETEIGSESELKLEHFAFSASGFAEQFESFLKSKGEQYHRLDIADINLTLINLWDPDGNHVHVDFPLTT